jgi:DNA modification methylase
MTNRLYYGDNLEVLRTKIKDESVDLCYIDPPFNSKRNYNQIYNNIGGEDRAQAQAFTDTWVWDDVANEGLQQILVNYEGRFTSQSIELIKGLRNVLKEGSLLAYLVSMTLRITEIHRTLKSTGSFYFHCDQTASHYLKLVIDSIFCAKGGDYKREIIWSTTDTSGFKSRAKNWVRSHDTIFFYTKSDEYYYKKLYWENNEDYLKRFKKTDEKGLKYRDDRPGGRRQYLNDLKGKTIGDVWDDIDSFQQASTNAEYLGYPTQKREAILERILEASSVEGDSVLDAYCGCGTTVAVAERLRRRWVGIDITYQSISLVLRRLEKTFGKKVLGHITLDGIPRDVESAIALAHKKDDRLRKEFEKWAVLTYSNNRAIINDKKGADKGIDGVAYFMTGKTDNAKIIFQVKSGGVKRNDIATLRGDMEREQAALAILITLEKPSKPMIEEAKAAGLFNHEQMGRSYDRIQIVTAEEIVEQHERLEIPMSLEVLKDARRDVDDTQLKLGL